MQRMQICSRLVHLANIQLAWRVAREKTLPLEGPVLSSDPILGTCYLLPPLPPKRYPFAFTAAA